MSLRVVFLRLLGLARKASFEHELHDEIESHLESAELDYRRAGMSPKEARAAARRSFGAIEAMKEEHRDQRTFRGLESLAQDWRFALRSALRSGPHSALIVVTFALGIAGSTGVFSVYDRLFIRSLPFIDAERLVDLDERAENVASIRLSYANFLAWREQAKTFESMAAWAETGYNLSLGDSSERIHGARVTHDLDDVLRIVPVLGRAIVPEENLQNGAKSAVLGYELWKRRFSGRPDVLGERIRLNGEAYTVVGVLPQRASFPDKAEVWTPLQTDPRYGVGWFLLGVGRLAEGVTIRSAQAELDRLQEGLVVSGRDDFVTFPVVTSLRERYLGDYKTGASLVLAAVGAALLIACANAAGLMLVGAVRRRPELVTRMALGASRRRVIRQLVTEGIHISLLGGLLGVALGWAVLRGMLAFRPEELPRWIEFDLDGRFLWFAVAVTLGAGILAGLVSALRATHADAGLALRPSAAKGSSAKDDRRSLNALVVGQAGLALALLMVTGLLVQALEKVRAVEPGFDPSNVLTFTLSLPRVRYPDPGERVRFFQSLLSKMQGVPGVRTAGAASLPPLEGYSGTNLVTESSRLASPDEERDPRVLLQGTVADYFATMRINLIEGRRFDSRDSVPGAPSVVIVNESFARYHFGDQSPVGHRVRYGHLPDSWMTIVGVCGDVRHFGPEHDAPLGAYIPMAQGADAYSTMTVVVKAAGGAVNLTPQVLQIARDMAPGIPAYGLVPLEQRLAGATLVRRAYTWLASVFAFLALGLTGAGFYGVTAYLVRQRRREIGIRIALGEQRTSIQKQIVGHALALAACGAAIGFVVGGYASVLLDSVLFGLPAWAPGSALAAGTLMLGVVLLASWIPARRASWANPIELLRSE